MALAYVHTNVPIMESVYDKKFSLDGHQTQVENTDRLP